MRRSTRTGSLMFLALIAGMTYVRAEEPTQVGSRTRTPASKPNVILIVTDDLGYGDLGFQGGRDIPTPHLDSLARQGVRFTNAYVTGAICGPTRAGLMSGRYQQRHSGDGNPTATTGLNVREATLADVLHAGGYATGAVGKWHLGQLPEYRPLRRGFDEFFGFYGAMHAYIPGPVDESSRMVFESPRNKKAPGGQTPAPGERPAPGKASPPGPLGDEGGGRGEGVNPGLLIRGDKQVAEPAYLTEAFARESVDFIDRHRDKPYFLYLCFNASHSPLQPPDKYLERFPALKGKRKAYAATTSALDDAVGEVLEKVRELGQEENTLIYYTNDNGGPIDDIAASNSPLGGAKFSLWEGGIRVPSFVRWKGHIPEGMTLEDPVISLDIFPTILAAAELSPPPGKQLEGINLLPRLLGQPDHDLPDRALFWRHGPNWAVRQGRWKLVQPERGEPIQLFDLVADVGENQDLAKRHPEDVRRLRENWERWDSQNLSARAGGR